MPQIDPVLLERAKKMRREPTPTEAAMWRILRAKQFEGLKFARHVVIAPYIADFVARSRKLIIESMVTRMRYGIRKKPDARIGWNDGGTR